MADDDVHVDGFLHPRMSNFITQIIDEDIAAGRIKSTVTRFPPEPNGYLHLGHAKSICLNFGLAKQYNGVCHLRFDDTNPATEDDEYIQSIQEDVKWLGWDWGSHLYFTSDYFHQMYHWAIKLIELGLAYVDDASEEEVRRMRGNLKEPGVESPSRNRSVADNLQMFEKMRLGNYPDGHCILRAKIDMSHGNMNMRDPPLYRIKHAHHPRTGDEWCIYPIYDFAHGQADSIEKITHSICTLEFFDHRMLYDWFQHHLGIFKTQQIEFARFNLTYTVMSKRRLLCLVKDGYVRGWSDPRMPTLCGVRRRGYPPAAIRKFAFDIGVAKRNNTIGMDRLESCIRDALHSSPRRLAVIDPVKIVIENWPQGKEPETLTAPNHPDQELGDRNLTFGPELFIEKSDFMESRPDNYYRLSPGFEVRLRYAYWIKCSRVVKDEEGIITEVICTYDPETKGGRAPPDGRKVKGIIHWISADDSVRGEARIYENLFICADPDEGAPERSWEDNLNPASLKVMGNARFPTDLASAKPLETYQFERSGFFTADEDTKPDWPVFNLTVGLTDTYAAQTEASKLAKVICSITSHHTVILQTKEAEKKNREAVAEERRAKREAKALREAAKLKGQQT